MARRGCGARDVSAKVLTPDEARKIICPFALARSTTLAPKHHHCQADKCMAWRDAHVRVVLPNATRWERRPDGAGYCALVK